MHLAFITSLRVHSETLMQCPKDPYAHATLAYSQPGDVHSKDMVYCVMENS